MLWVLTKRYGWNCKMVEWFYFILDNLNAYYNFITPLRMCEVPSPHKLYLNIKLEHPPLKNFNYCA